MSTTTNVGRSRFPYNKEESLLILELFIAVFGIIYFGSRLSSEKVKKKSVERHDEQRKSRKGQWLEEHTDSLLEKEMSDFVKDPSNYNQVRSAIEPELEELPILKNSIKFGDAWYKCNLYEEYWQSGRGNMTKNAHKEHEHLLKRATDMMLVLEGVVPASFGYTNFDFEHSIQFFKWCVKKLRLTAGITDPVARRETATKLWEYNFSPLLLDGGQVVSDDEIVPRSAE